LQKIQSKNNLTPRQIQLLCLIKKFQDNNFYLPTIGELASELGISRSTTFEHIEELRKKGYLSNGTGRARSLELSLKAHKLPALSAQEKSNLSIQKTEGISLAGRVAAGLPIEAIENKESLSLKSCFGNTEEIFALEVQGDSMTGDGISDGDYVICRKSSTADDGQLVVAIVDGENATLKRFYKETNKARLQPSNDEYQPIYSENCRIEAVVIGLIRKL
jgi:repressor LexA